MGNEYCELQWIQFLIKKRLMDFVWSKKTIMFVRLTIEQKNGDAAAKSTQELRQ